MVVPAPAIAERRLDLQAMIDYLQRIDDERIVGAANAVPHQLQKTCVDDLARLEIHSLSGLAVVDVDPSRGQRPDCKTARPQPEDVSACSGISPPEAALLRLSWSTHPDVLQSSPHTIPDSCPAPTPDGNAQCPRHRPAPRSPLPASMANSLPPPPSAPAGLPEHSEPETPPRVRRTGRCRTHPVRPSSTAATPA